MKTDLEEKKIKAKNKEAEESYKRGQIAQAFACWQELFEEGQADEKTIVRLADLLRAMNRLERAEEVISFGLEMNPGSHLLFKRHIQILKQQKRWEAVIRSCQKVLSQVSSRQDNQVLQVCRERVKALVSAQRNCEAREFVEQQLLHLPLAIDREMLRLELALQEKDWLRADEIINTLQEQNVCDEKVWQLSATLARQKDGEQPEQKYAHAVIEKSQKSMRDPLVLASLCESAGLFSSAEGYLETAQNVLSSARYYMRRGNYGKALEFLKSAEKDGEPGFNIAREIFVLESIAAELKLAPSEEFLLPDLAYKRLFEKTDFLSSSSEPYDQNHMMVVIGRLSAGGAQRQIVNLARGIKNRFGEEKKLSVFCLSEFQTPSDSFYREQLPGVEIFRNQNALEFSEEESALLRPLEIYIRHLPFGVQSQIRHLFVTVFRTKPGVLYAYLDMANILAALVGNLLGVPRILASWRNLPTVDREVSEPVQCIQAQIQSLYRHVESYTDTAFTALSEAAAEGYSQWIGKSSSNVRVIYNGVDIDALIVDTNVSSQHRSTLGIPAGAPVIGGVFRLHPQKQPLEWIKMAEMVSEEKKDAHFILLGEGPLHWEVQSQVESSPIRNKIHLVGIQSDIANWIALFDVLAMTTKMEGLCNALLEAQALGVPVVAPAVGGVPEAIEDTRTGFLVPVPVPELVSERVLWILENLAWAQAASHLAPGFIASKFSMDRFLHETTELCFGKFT